mgnify:CR=1 FL=1
MVLRIEPFREVIGMDGRDIRTGESVKVGCYVDEGVYDAFRSWVDETAGKQYGAVGNALTRAMLEHMDDERVEDELRELNDTVKQNNALLRKLRSEIEKKEKEDADTDADAEDRGNAPGDRARREAKVLNAVLSQGMTKISHNGLEKAIRAAADVSSEPTIEDYVRALTQTSAVDSARASDYYYIDAEAARELCQKRGVPVSEAPVGDGGAAADD